MIHIAIIEDNVKFREGLQFYLDAQENFACDLLAESMERFFDILSMDHLPDVILMDIGLPGMSGIHGMKLLKEKYPEIDIIILTVYNDANKIFEALSVGASGYLLKNESLKSIKEAIEVLYGGGSLMSPQIARKVMKFFSNQPLSKDLTLSHREKEVVIGLVDGLSYKMIGVRLNIGLETVRSHIKNIYQKLHVNSKAEVIKKFFRGEI